MLDVVLAYAHHIAVFGFAGMILAEFVMVKPGLTGARLNQIAKIDRAYGLFAKLVIIAGVTRVFFGSTGESYYFANPVFWTKIALFVLVGLLSIAPTMAIIRWRKAAVVDGQYVVPENAIRGARRWIHIELFVLALIPLAAAAMARGVGL